jgi:hypothetical protein
MGGFTGRRISECTALGSGRIIVPHGESASQREGRRGLTLEPFTSILAARQRGILADVEHQQRRLLSQIMGRSATGVVAGALHLDANASFDDFLAVEPREYAFYRPFVERTLSGEPNVFGREPITALGETSGSSGEPKLIPHTARSLATIQRFAKRVLLFQMCEGQHYFPRFTKWLLVSASTNVRRDRSVPIGFISGLMYEIAQKQRREFILPSPAVAAIEDWKQRIEKAVEEAWTKPVGAVFGVPAYLERFFEAAVSRNGGRPLAEIWPELGRIYYSGTPLASSAYFERLLGRPVITRGMYSATEGSFGAELDARFPGGLLMMVDLVVFTFRDPESSSGRMLAAWQLERGRTYEIAITTQAGLLQYRIGDLVEVTETQPLRIRVAGRVGEEINLATEKLSVKQARGALERIARSLPVVADRFVVIPDPESSHRHLWIIEGDAAATSVLAPLDAAIADANPSYKALRAGNAVLEPPRVVVVPRGSFDGYVSEGFAKRGQFKFRHLWRDLDALSSAPGMGFTRAHAP